MSVPLFIISDLNIDLISVKGDKLYNFMANLNLSNYVNGYTLIASRYYNNSDKFLISKSLIDVVLHNDSLIDKTDIIECPFSDHSFVTLGIST